MFSGDNRALMKFPIDYFFKNWVLDRERSYSANI